MKITPIPAEVIAHFSYDPASKSRLAVAGREVGWRSGHYYAVQAPGRVMYLAHRIVWAIHHGDPGDLQIDHADGNKLNNSIENLRVATHGNNGMNRVVQSNNKMGVKGLSWVESLQCWRGRVYLNHKEHTRYSKDRATVERWLVQQREILHGEFARH